MERCGPHIAISPAMLRSSNGSFLKFDDTAVTQKESVEAVKADIQVKNTHDTYTDPSL